MSAWHKLLEKPHARGHLVQLYGVDDPSLIRNVSQYLWGGLKRGGGALVIATPEHRGAFCRELDRLGARVESAVEEKRLVLLDAQQTISLFMPGGRLDWEKFEGAVGAAMREVSPGSAQARANGAGLRAYGEMVGLLWDQGQFAAAIRLEQFWNKLLARSAFSLYCAYAIDIFDKEFQVGALDAILSAHTHFVPGETQGSLENAVNLAMNEILGSKADGLRILIKENYSSSWAVMPKGEAIILWLRKNVPDRAEQIVARARDYYRSVAVQNQPAPVIE